MSEFDNQNVFNGGNVFQSNDDNGSMPFINPVHSDQIDEGGQSAVADGDAAPDNPESNEVDAKPRRRGRKPGRRKRADSPSGSGITPDTIRKILDYHEKLEMTDDETRNLAGTLLGVDATSDEDKFIAELMNPSKIKNAMDTIQTLASSYTLSDAEFALALAIDKDHADRKAMYELEEKIAPEKARELTNGRFPHNNPKEEVLIIRRIQKESPNFQHVIDSILELLKF